MDLMSVVGELKSTGLEVTVHCTRLGRKKRRFIYKKVKQSNVWTGHILLN